MPYLSDESGRQEVQVQSYPVPGGKYQVSTGGPNWVGFPSDGKRLIYGLSSDPTRGLQAEVQAGGEFPLGPPRWVITLPKDQCGLRPNRTRTRLIALHPAGKDPTPSIAVVLDGLPGGPQR